MSVHLRSVALISRLHATSCQSLHHHHVHVHATWMVHHHVVVVIKLVIRIVVVTFLLVADLVVAFFEVAATSLVLLVWVTIILVVIVLIVCISSPSLLEVTATVVSTAAEVLRVATSAATCVWSLAVVVSILLLVRPAFSLGPILSIRRE